MKKLLPFTCLLLFSAVLHAQSLVRPTHMDNKPVIINGYFKGLKDGTQVIIISFDKDYWLDSAIVKNGHFSFRMDQYAGRSATLRLTPEHLPGKWLDLYIDKGIMNIITDENNINHLKISGSPYAMDYSNYYNMLKTNGYFRKSDQIKTEEIAAMKNNDTVSYSKIGAELDTLYSLRRQLDKPWIAAHKNSLISSYIVYHDFWAHINKAELGTMLNSLSSAAKKNVEANQLEQEVYAYEHLRPGLPAIDFTQADTNGKLVSLKDFRGKYVLLNFWASWCGPCRAENPELVRIFNKYNNKGFTILSISLDQSKGSWLKAINTDKLNWTHVSDLKDWSNEVSLKYGIYTIPQSILIAPDGTIIDNIADTDTLEKKLAQILK